MAGKRWSGDAAVGSSVVAFLVAGVLFIASVVAVLVTTRDSTSSETVGDPLRGAQLNVQAASLANLLLDSPGYTTNGAEFGQAFGLVGHDGKLPTADSVSRLGLLDPDAPEPFMMDFAKFQNLRQAPFAADPTDQYVNYEEARRQLGLDRQGLDFHIRSYPNLRSYQELLSTGTRDENLKVAYIADATRGTDDPDPYGNLLRLEHPSGAASGTCVVAALPPADHSTVAPGLHCATTAPNPFTCTATTKGYRIATMVRNSGSDQTRFKGVFSLRFGASDSESRTQYTHAVPAGAAAQLFTDVAATPGRSCSALQVTFQLYDPDQKILEIVRVVSQPSPAPAPTTKGLNLKLTGAVWEDGDDIDFTYTGIGLTTSDKVLLTVCPGETECRVGADMTGLAFPQDVPGSENRREFEVDAASLPVGQYTARLYLNPGGGSSAVTSQFRSTTRLIVLANANPDADLPPYSPPDGAAAFTGNYDSGSAVATEVQYVEELMEQFCPYWYDSTTKSPLSTPAPYGSRCGSWRTGWPHQGDVYSTDGTQLKRNIEARLFDDATDCDNDGDVTDDPAVGGDCWTDILIVGSEVDHEKLTNGQVKNTIEAWVYAGGTLIVFGSSDQKTEWLQSIFHTALESGEHGNGVSVPDEGHPVLNVPNDLAWDAYGHRYAWSLKETGSFNAEEAFTRVVNEEGGTSSNPANTVLAVGDPGDFQLGNVIITGWTPWDLEADGALSSPLRSEGRMFVHNLLMLGYTDLYLDYGPALPEQANVVPAVRNVQICHPGFDETLTPLCDDPIPMAMQVYVFRGA